MQAPRIARGTNHEADSIDDLARHLAGRLTICHHTTKPTNAWFELTIASSALPDHLATCDEVCTGGTVCNSTNGCVQPCTLDASLCTSAQIYDPVNGCVCTIYTWIAAHPSDTCEDYRTGDLTGCAVTSPPGPSDNASCTWNCGGDTAECYEGYGCLCT